MTLLSIDALGSFDVSIPNEVVLCFSICVSFCRLMLIPRGIATAAKINNPNTRPNTILKLVDITVDVIEAFTGALFGSKVLVIFISVGITSLPFGICMKAFEVSLFIFSG